jgi:hypothetical protein
MAKRVVVVEIIVVLLRLKAGVAGINENIVL